MNLHLLINSRDHRTYCSTYLASIDVYATLLSNSVIDLRILTVISNFAYPKQTKYLLSFAFQFESQISVILLLYIYF